MKLFTVLLLGSLAGFTSLIADDKEKPAAQAEAPAHEAKNVSPDEAEKLLNRRKDVVVLDVRTPAEFEEGHIAGAKNIDFTADDFADRLKKLDASKPYLVHCAAGGRSTRATTLMNKLKFAEIYHMNDGFSAWKAAGKPVEK